jgi:hypothetical protein
MDNQEVTGASASADRASQASPGAAEASPPSGDYPSRVRVVTFEVDAVKLFDTLNAMGGDFGPIGDRVVGALMCEPSWSDAVGMAVYGISLVRPRDSDGSPDGGDACGSVHDSAGRNGIANPAPAHD